MQNRESRVAPSGAYDLVGLTCAINMSLLTEFRTWIFRHGSPPENYGLVWLMCAINISLLAEFRTWIFVGFR
jgi:hypothetical protein